MKVKVKNKVELDAKFIDCKIGVRYWEDATVNGEEDTEGSLIPFRDEDDYFKIRIDIETGIIEGWPEGTTANIHYKVCDDGVYTLVSSEGVKIIEKDGYVPEFLSIEENGYGDYVIFNVDKNGKVENWKFNPEDVKQFK